MVPLIWADVVPDHKTIIAVVVFGDNTVSLVTSVAAGVWVGAVFLFVHVEPVFISASVAPLYTFVGFVGDVIRLSFILEGHCRASGVVVEEGGDSGGSFRGSKLVEHLLLCVRCFVLFFEKVASLFDQFSLLFCQSLVSLYEVLKLTVELD
jgi:hypothetical protein